MILQRLILVLTCVCLSSGVRNSLWPRFNCSEQGLRCTVNIYNCMDRGWLDVKEYTPSGPEDLRVSVDTSRDEAGQLQSVLVANWTIKDEGSISFLTATELQVLVVSTNQNLCLRYSFKDKLPMRKPSGEKWSFSANVVVDPGNTYRISVFNIPKPELGHSSYDVSKDISIPDCRNSAMQLTQFCTHRGSLWQPNINLAQIAVSGGSALSVSFSHDILCEEYLVIVRCSAIQHHRTCKDSNMLCFNDQTVCIKNPHLQANQSTVNVTFSLDKWPRSCCQFDAEIKPFFPECGNDCTRRRRTLDICPAKSTPVTPTANTLLYTCGALGVFICVLMCVFCRKPDKPSLAAVPAEGEELRQQQKPKHTPTVLVIYSQDHHLYREVVLKFCVFLQAKCGIKVVMDLLDTTSVGMLGRLPWLERQRQRLKNPSDKILVLCSRGVQAKWRAMCGQLRVTLREDVLSPTDDMLTPFLNLFLPDMHQTGMLSKYMVAYFNDISSEQDVPSVFDIGVKYNLMKHFEELYFGILDMEKYEPHQINHIEGISGDEYFNCPSGAVLKNAIETFQAYQLENPDWFEMECVDSEEEVMAEANQLIEPLYIPPVLECVPLIRDGLPIYVNELEINESGHSVYVLTPELNTESEQLPVAEVMPIVTPEYSSNLDEVTDHLYHYSPSPGSVCIIEPVLNKLPPLRQNCLLEQDPLGQLPTEDEEEDSLQPMRLLSTHSQRGGSALQKLLDSNSPGASIQSDYFPPSKISHSQPVEKEECVVLKPSGKGQSSGSDQGYISKMSSPPEPPFKEDQLVALRRLQEELFQKNLRYLDIGTEEDRCPQSKDHFQQ